MVAQIVWRKVFSSPVRGNRPRCCIYKSLELGVLFLETSREVGVIYTYLKKNNNNNKVDNLEDPFLIGIIIIQRKVKSNKKNPLLLFIIETNYYSLKLE